jgi:uncharacterized radical SAM superfamily Fe-S cluster-containing enzyme
MDTISAEPRLLPGNLLSTTESVCPHCLRTLPAERIERGGVVYLRKTCPDHGSFETVIWRGGPAFSDWNRPKIPAFPEHPNTKVDKGCPYDCGLCPDHRQQPCCVLLEVTQRCDLGCPVCYASAGGSVPPDPDMRTVEKWYRKLIRAGGPFNIQLSGGEPTLRDDLPEIIRLGRSLGFTFFQLNTNGLRIARDREYLRQLKFAGLSVVYLQFDGVDDRVYQRIRGRKLLEEKLAAIQNCLELEIGVILVPTIIPGVNDHEIGDILRFALKYHPGVRGVHYQPVSYFGRYTTEPANEQRITLPEIIAGLEEQTAGLVKAASFKPASGPNPHCSFHGNFVVMPDGKLSPMTRFDPESCCTPKGAGEERIKAQTFVAKAWVAPKFSPQKYLPGPSLGEWDTFLARSKTHLLAISGMAFQDAWTLDLERLKGCYIMTVAPDGRIIPFCAYNLTRSDGVGLYRCR